MRDFTLTESLCDQAVLVRAKSRGWKEWFSNPTAGPWKRIGVPGVSSLAGTGFEKEETRPDLILFHNTTDPIILILETKDKIDKLLDNANKNAQLKKTSEVFVNIQSRLDALIQSSTDSKLRNSAAKISYVCGYATGEDSQIVSKTLDLKRIHLKFAKKENFRDFVLLTVHKTGLDLSICVNFIHQQQTSKSTKLEKFFNSFF